MTLSKAVNFTLEENEISFITDMLKTGRFANRAEVIRAGLRLLEDYEYQQKTKRLQVLIAQGDADIKAGRMAEYASANALANRIKGE